MAARLQEGALGHFRPVRTMLLHITLLLLVTSNQIGASPTFVEFINSGLSFFGAKYVPPPSSASAEEETVIDTRQGSCRDCSREVKRPLIFTILDVINTRRGHYLVAALATCLTEVLLTATTAIPRLTHFHAVQGQDKVAGIVRER